MRRAQNYRGPQKRKVHGTQVKPLPQGAGDELLVGLFIGLLALFGVALLILQGGS